MLSWAINFPNKKWSQPFDACPPYDDFKIFCKPPCSSKFHNMTTMIRQYTKFPLLLVSPGKPVYQPIHYPIANFRPLSRGSVPNPMLITAFNTYLSPRSMGAWYALSWNGLASFLTSMLQTVENICQKWTFYCPVRKKRCTLLPEGIDLHNWKHIHQKYWTLSLSLY